MPEPKYIIVTADGRDDMVVRTSAVTIPEWPEFMLNDPVSNRYWAALYRDFPEYQFILADPATDEIMASCNSVPLAWEGAFEDLPDEGWDWALKKAFEDLKAGKPPTIQCALSVTIPKKFREMGLSVCAIRAMKEIGRAHGLNAMVAPVRPSFKHKYPHTPMISYLKWCDSKGIPKDPWVKVHAREGAKIIKVCRQSMRITGTISQWEGWTGMRFPGSDKYIVPGALVPIIIDWDKNQGVYVEPNVWMVHHFE